MADRTRIGRRSTFHALNHSRSSSPNMFRPTKPEDWERFKEPIADLYTTMKLKDVMAEMQARHGFKATEKQYKTQLKKWSLDTKYIKASEYITMIKIKREREREDPPRQTQFVLRGRVVDPRDITRFEKRAIKKGNPIPDDNEYDQEALEELTYDDPPPEGTEYAYDETEASTSQYAGTYDTTQYTTSQYDTTYATTSYATAQYGTQYGSTGYDAAQYDDSYYTGYQ
jgi:hypothetical protein